MTHVMKTLNRLFAALAVAATALSCANVETAIVEPARKETALRTFSARFDVPTRTSVTVGQTGKVSWVAGDEISILDGKSNVKVVLSSDNISEDGYTASFSAAVSDAETYVAVYPYSASACLDPADPSLIHIAGPSQDQDGTFSDAHISAGVFSADDSSFTFRNITGVINFTLTDPDVSKFVFRGNASESLSGPACFVIDGSGVLADWDGEDLGKSLSFPANSAGEYFIGTLETSLESGFRISCYDKEGLLCASASSTAPLELGAGRIVRLGDIASHLVKETETVVPFPYSEPFDSGIGDFVLNDVKLPSASSYVWKFDSSYGMKASAYIKKNYASESWLISPFIDLTTASSAALSFSHAANQFKGSKPNGSLKVMASSDGSNWTALTVPVWPSGKDWNFVESGKIDLTAYVGGKVKIAFVYTSTTSVCGTWEIKNVKVGVGDAEALAAFYATTTCGIYRPVDGETVKAYVKYTEQLGYGSGSFTVADPNSLKYYRITGLPEPPVVGVNSTITLEGNFSGIVPGDMSATVGKVEGDLVWLNTPSGLGFIIKM